MSFKVSVITVCFNAEKTIRDTIESVLSQSFTDFEYIIVDGKSKDNTNGIIAGFDDAFSAKGIEYKHVSEPDNGIYDAMNKGAGLASGEWIIFMNADDRFSDPEVLKDIFGDCDYSGYDVVYGDSYRVKGDLKKLDKADKDIKLLRDYKFFCR